MDTPTPDAARPPRTQRLLDAYWRRNLWIMFALLTCWGLVSLGAGVLWADALNRWRLPGTAYPLGFWFAQQGSILGFLAIIFIYAVLMNRLDRSYHEKVTREKEPRS